MKKLDVSEMLLVSGGSKFWDGFCTGVATSRVLIYAFGISLGPGGLLAANVVSAGCISYAVSKNF